LLSALEAELTVEPHKAARREDLMARGAVRNRGDEPVEVDLAPLSSPSLALDVVEEGGAPVRLPPPPVPRGEVLGATLAAGEAVAVEFPAFLPAWTPPGAYRVRLRYLGAVGTPGRTVEVVSDWVDFIVGEP
jgi:hypothetical protein